MEWLKQNKRLAALIAAGVLAIVAHFAGVDIGALLDSAGQLAGKLNTLVGDNAQPAADAAAGAATAVPAVPATP